MGKSAQDIYATALTILQVGLLTIQLPPNPDFNSLSPEEKDRIYQDLHNQIDSLTYLLRISFAHRALSCGDTGPALESGLADQEFVMAFVCRFQVILLHGYINFSNDWRSTAKTSRPIHKDRFRRWFSSSRTTWSSVPIS
jgi:hypothetical protein